MKGFASIVLPEPVRQVTCHVRLNFNITKTCAAERDLNTCVKRREQ